MPRYFIPSSPLPPPADPQAELLASLERINTFNPPVQTCSTGWHFSGLYTGPTSVAYLFYRLSQIYPDMTFKGQSLADWAASYLELGRSYLPGDKRANVDADHCGVANETLCQVAIRACMDHDASLAEELCSYTNSLLDPATGSDEWLYGRAGYLYLLRLVRASFKQIQISAVHHLLDRAVTVTSNRMLSTPQPWQWHGSNYFGAVHGSIGIITQIVLSSSDPKAISPKLKPILEDLLTWQRSSGNFPSSRESQSDKLIQFCHGSPGFVPCLQSISTFFPSLQEAIDTAIERTQPDLLKHGLLIKDPCLCHGIPTNALALISNERFEEHLRYMASDQLEDRKEWMGKAGQRDDFVGLYTGEAGRAWTWAVLDQTKRGTNRWEMGVIGFNDV